MTVPTPIPFSEVPIAGVLTSNLSDFLFKLDATTIVNLANGAVGTGTAPTLPVFYLPGAALVLT